METIRKIPWGGGTTLLAEVDATDGDRVVNFINDKIKFPTYVTSAYSGLGVKFVITFQAIQNYIPDSNGNQLPNTIDNSLKIFNAFASDGLTPTPISMFDVTTVNGKVTINLKSGVSYPETLVLPAFDENGNQITNISANFGSVPAKKIVVPAGYTSIDEKAFQNNKTIQSIDLSQTSITEVPARAFYDSTITTVALPNTVTELKSFAFRDSNLTTINIPDGVIKLSGYALYNTKLVSVYIPKSVKTIEDAAIFSGSLKKIVVDDENEYFYDIDEHVLASNDGRLIYMAPANRLIHYDIPEGITKIASFSLYAYTSMQSLSFPASLQTIAGGGLPQKLLSVSIHEDNPNFSAPTGQEIIDSTGNLIKYFYNKDITEYILPNEVIKIPEDAFNNVTLNKIVISQNLSQVEYGCFSGAVFKSIDVAESNQYFYKDGYALISATNNFLIKLEANYSSSEYTIPNYVVSVDADAFRGCDSLITINLPSSIQNVQTGAFGNCKNLTYLNINSNITTIRGWIIQYTNIEQINVYGEIIDACFAYASKLKKVTFKTQVVSVGKTVFVNNPLLETVVFEGSVPPVFTSNLLHSGTTPNTFKIYVPDSAVEAYKAVANLASYKDRIYGISQLNT